MKLRYSNARRSLLKRSVCVCVCVMINLKIISNEEYKAILKVKKLKIFYGQSECPFGECFIGLLGDSICHMSFVTGSQCENYREVMKQWPRAELHHETSRITKIANDIFHSPSSKIDVVLRGTDFEGKVWRELLNIPRGKTRSYSDVAKAIGEDKAVRAVANAVAKNSVAYLVPCHRVIKKDGQIHKYRWGTSIKEKILRFEGGV